MSGTIHGSGMATQTAANLLRQYAVDLPGVAPAQRDHIRFVAAQLEKDFMELRRQRDHARQVAISFAENGNISEPQMIVSSGINPAA